MRLHQIHCLFNPVVDGSLASTRSTEILNASRKQHCLILSLMHFVTSGIARRYFQLHLTRGDHFFHCPILPNFPSVSLASLHYWSRLPAVTSGSSLSSIPARSRATKSLGWLIMHFNGIPLQSVMQQRVYS
jgi:hypothetical protein